MTALKTLIIPLLLVFLLVPDQGYLQEEGEPQSLPISRLIVQNENGAHVFEVELATTRGQQRIGLMFRREMAKGHGMLFYYSSPQRVSFWMKNTYIPLDIIFIRENGTIANIVHNAEPHSLSPIKSRGSVVGVLELNAGLANKLEIKKGDIVHHEVFKNATGERDD